MRFLLTLLRAWASSGLGLVALVVCAGAGGCTDDGGAVTVRWRIVELSDGRIWNPATDTEIAGSDGFCCHKETDANGHQIQSACIDPNATAQNVAAWVVKTVDVQLASPDGQSDMAQLTTGQGTPCTAGELTTPFKLPAGRFAVSLVAHATNRSGAVTLQVSTPAPEIRDIVRGGIVNLQVIEIAVNPLPLPLPGTAAMVTK